MVWPGPTGAPGTGAFQCVGGISPGFDGGGAVAGGASLAQGGAASTCVGSELEDGSGPGASTNVGATAGARGVGGGVISPVVWLAGFGGAVISPVGRPLTACGAAGIASVGRGPPLELSPFWSPIVRTTTEM